MPGLQDETPGNETEESKIRHPGRPAGGWQLWIGIVFSIIFLVLALRGIDFGETANALRRVNIPIIFAVAANFILSMIAKAARWLLLLSVKKKPSFRRTFSVLSIGLMVNAFLPTRLGEIARAYLLGEAEADSKVYILGTIAVEKASDLFSLLVLLALLLFRMALPEWLVAPARSTAIILVILVPVLAFLVWKRDFMIRIVERIDRVLPARWRGWLVRQAGHGLTSLEAIRKPRLLFGLILWSLVIWALSALTNYYAFIAFRLALPLEAALLLLLVLQIGTAVPSSPGSIGVFQYLVILALSFFGVEKNIALGYSLILYVVIFLPIAMLGIWGLWSERVSWNKLTEALARISEGRKKD